MATFNALGLVLSVILGSLFLAFVAEVYYLLWWKRKRIATSDIEQLQPEQEAEAEDYAKYAKELFHFICWTKPASTKHTTTTTTTTDQATSVTDLSAVADGLDEELGNSKELLLKTLGEESAESELMRLHNLSGPPRFLFTIKEETKEDLESDDGRSRGDKSRKGSRTRSLSDVMLAIDQIQTPFLHPLASPPLKLSSSTSAKPLENYRNHGFNNPLFESLAEAEWSRVPSSPPPKFKFLRDAEEKLYRRLRVEAAKYVANNNGHFNSSEVTKGEEKERDGRAGSVVVGLGKKNGETKENIQSLALPQHCPSSHSQVLPLASSPTTFRPLDN